MKPMRPNAEQLAAIKITRTLLNYWEQTNDLSSPTHHVNIDDLLLDDSEHKLGIRQKFVLDNALVELLRAIRLIGELQNRDQENEGN